MIVPIEILRCLECSNCDNFLTCGPVLCKDDGSNFCGRCSSLAYDAIPNMPYNELAEMCAFPCKYQEEGCYEKITFACMKEHEADCEFRSYICPVMPSGSCDWVGTRNNILEHTEVEHPEKILPHPCEMKHDVRKASLKSFLMTAFDVLFLIHTKVCLTTYTMYHSVRKIGEISDSLLYKYEIKVDIENGSLTRRGMVAPQGCLALHKDSSIGIKINSMMEALQGFKDSRFFITIYKYMRCFTCKKIKSPSQFRITDRINEIFVCFDCTLELKCCPNSGKGCFWKGAFVKDHQSLFCPFTRWCRICKKNITEFSMLDHIQKKSHGIFDIKQLLLNNFSTVNDNTQLQWFSFNAKSSCYLLTCEKLHDNLYKFTVLGHYKDVKKMKCYLKLKNECTNYFTRYCMEGMFSDLHGQYIWQLHCRHEILYFFLANEKYQVGIDIDFNEL